MDRVSRVDGRFEERRGARRQLAEGTLACPSCDFPTAPGGRTLKPADAFGCSYCGHAGVVRDFLTLTDAPRPARVTVTVRIPPLTRR